MSVTVPAKAMQSRDTLLPASRLNVKAPTMIAMSTAAAHHSSLTGLPAAAAGVLFPGPAGAIAVQLCLCMYSHSSCCTCAWTPRQQPYFFEDAAGY